ncbi:hypothetical protein INT45_003467 [Circinella minor]|uniref:Zn(2)-C6 fungal-type domain-containing protein n=1 Tax=Circinella minor TaxID=1195481 RepID=A0A8H7S7Z9_9FUNG|nr:hypothetical protein INT45_003467 [Circinella minor]
MNKKFPCEECREQKRKCDSKQPCDRCERFNLKCIYVKAVSPRDQEYVQLAKREGMRSEIEALTKQTEMLERELQGFHSAMQVQHQHSPPMLAKDDVSSSNKENATASKLTTARTSSYLIPLSPIDLMMTAPTPPDSSSSDNNSVITTKSYDYRYSGDKKNQENNAKRRRVIAKKGDFFVAIERDDKRKPWILTVQNGRMIIETFINNHSDLMGRMWDMTSTLCVQNSVPFSFHSFSTFGTLVKMFNTMMVNKYGKTYCRSMINSLRVSAIIAPISLSSPSNANNLATTTATTKPFLLSPSSSNSPSLQSYSSPIQDIDTLTMPLLKAFFHCRHLHQLALHIPTFMRLFITKYSHNISTSPVAMALCASICVGENSHCHHITKLIPPTQIIAQGKLYYEKARQLISDRFDDLCLETFATFIFLTSYKLYTPLKTDDDNDSDHYLTGQWCYGELAERYMHLLEPYFMKITTVEGSNNTPLLLEEAILFQRLRNYLQQLTTLELAYKFKVNDPNMRETGYVRFYEASHTNHGLQWAIANDDSDEQSEFIEMKKALQQLRKEIFENSRASGILSQDLTVLTETVIQQQVQHTTAHWYMHVLPEKLKLPLPVLEATSTSDSHYFATLKEQCEIKGSIVPVLTVLELYDEIILIVQSFLHKRIPNPATNWYFLDQYWQGGEIMVKKDKHPAGEKWVRRITKLLSVKEAIEYKGTDDEFFSMVKEVMFPSQPVRTSVIQIGIQVSINMVRLLRFIQNSEKWSCFFDMRFLTDVWIVMFRTLRFEDYLDASDRRWLHVVRTNMEYCRAMAREHLGNNEDDLNTYIQGLDQDFQDYYATAYTG